MNQPIEITSLQTSGVEIFSSLTDNQLRNCSDIFIAESPKVIKVALEKGFQPISLLCERKHIAGDAAEIIASRPDMTVYTGDREILQSLTGYKLTRGVLCAMRRPPMPSVEQICSGAKRVAVLDGVCDTTNIGAIFRAAAALGIDAVLLTPTACDPLNRRAVRVSMGSVFLVPWTFLSGGIEELRQLGFKTLAMALRHDSISLRSPLLKAEPKLAIVLGTEGDGLADNVIADADYTVRIPMAHGVDSLNVASAAAIAFWQLAAADDSEIC